MKHKKGKTSSRCSGSYLEISQSLDFALCEDFISPQNSDIASPFDDTISTFASSNITSSSNVEHFLNYGRSDVFTFWGRRKDLLHAGFYRFNGIVPDGDCGNLHKNVITVSCQNTWKQFSHQQQLTQHCNTELEHRVL